MLKRAASVISPSRAGGSTVREGPPDHELVAALVSGDRTAGRQIWERYRSLVQGLLRGVFGPAEDMDDAVQEVFVRLLRSAHRIGDGALLRSYVVTLALNVARAELRRRKVRRLFALAHGSPAGARLPGLAPSAPVDPQTHAALGRLYAALDRLPTDERLLFTLRYVEELELAEIAAASRVSLATVKRRLARAIARLVARVRNDVLLAEYIEATREREGDA
jgi:RNA polymerase sigma-70 factor (ECF subfamily)